MAKAAAKHHLLVDYHGGMKPSGMRRAYPNIINYEAVKGLENDKWESKITPEHDLTIPFTRMTAGIMDYTPGGMDNAHMENFAVRYNRPMTLGTRAHQIALYVIFEAPLQMLADSPSNYYANKESAQFISRIPTTWEETKVLEAKISDYLVIARKNGDKWYLAGITDETPRNFNVELSFLDPNKEYTIEWIEDGVNSDRVAKDYSKKKKDITSVDHLELNMHSGGGWLAFISVKNSISSTSLTGEQTEENLSKCYEEMMISIPPDSLNIDSFYKKYTSAFGIPVISSEKVPDAALLVARDIVNYMLIKRFDVRETLNNNGARVLVMAQSEMETDLPERKNWKKPRMDDKRLTLNERENYDKPGGISSMTDKEYWNQRARGMGGTITSCAEENLLGYPGTRYYGENILVHEFSHNIMNALRTTDPELYKDIEDSYEKAKSKGLYKGQYAINTIAEYWAEGTQWWFWSNIEFYDGDTRVQTPDDLKMYDPELYNILDQVYQGHHIPCDVYYSQNIPPARKK